MTNEYSASITREYINSRYLISRSTWTCVHSANNIKCKLCSF